MVGIDLIKRAQDESSLSSAISVANGDQQQVLVKRPAEHQEIDFELVRQIRSRMKEEFEAEPEKYAPVHYGDIMDENNPCVCWRYLKHMHCNLEDALQLMKQALIWRQDFGTDTLFKRELCKELWHWSPIVFSGKSRDGHIIYYNIGKNFRKAAAGLNPYVKKFTIECIFGWDEMHKRDLKKMIIVFDTSNTGFRNIDLDYVAWLISIRDYFPCRVHSLQVLGIPFLIRPLVRLCISWLPERWSNIVKCGNLEDLIESGEMDYDNLPAEVGGTRDETYRIAPDDAPWSNDSPVFSDEKFLKWALDCIGFNIDDETKERRRQMQIDHDERKNKKRQEVGK